MAKLRLILSEAYLFGLELFVHALLILAPHPRVADWLIRTGLLKKIGIEEDANGDFQVTGSSPRGWK